MFFKRWWEIFYRDVAPRSREAMAVQYGDPGRGNDVVVVVDDDDC